MAEFDPVVSPTSDPSYTRDSRPIDVPNNINPRGVEQNQIMPQGVKEGDRSAEYVGKAAEYGLAAEGNRSRSFADLFSGITAAASYATGVADTLIKKSIENEVYAKADTQREIQIATLQDMLDGGQVKKSLLDANAQMTEEVPEELDELGDRLESLKGAGPSGTGRITNTNYSGRLHSIAKDLRARYPGYRQYIDTEIAKVTGMNPANSHIGHLIGEINRNQTSGVAQRNKTLTFITQNAAILGPYASKAYRAVEAGQIGMPEVLDMVRPKMAAKLQHEEDMRALENFNGSEKVLKTQATSAFERVIEQQTGTAVEGIMINTGTDEKTGLIDFLKKAKQGGFKSDEISNAGKWLLNVKIPELRLELNKTAAQPFGKSGRSYGTILGLAGRNEVTEAGLAELKSIGNALVGGESQLGIAFDTATDIAARQRDFTKKLMTNEKIAPRLQMLGAIEKFGGQAAVSGLLEDTLIEGWDADVKKFTNEHTLQFRAQAARENDSSYVTLNDAFKTAKRRNIPTYATKKLVDDVVNDLSKADIPPQMLQNLAAAAFSDGNLGFVEGLNRDGKDSRGNTVPGTYITWRQLTRPEVHKAMIKLRGINENLYNNYVNWVETTQKNLFSREVQQLNAIADDPRIKFGYSIQDNKFWVEGGEAEVRPTSSVVATASERALLGTGATTKDEFKKRVDAAKVAVHRINIGLDPIIQIAKTDRKTPEDVTAYILQKAQETGLAVSMKTEGLPAKMYKELLNAAMKSKKMEERQSKEREDLYGAVGR